MPVDLSKKYEGKFSIVTAPGSENEQPPQLTYAINNAEKDVTFNFQYTDTDEELDEKIPNPFKICQNNVCVTNIKTYEFKKGESYKIHVVMKKIGSDIALPAFSFADKNYKESSGNNGIILRYNLWIVSLLLLLL